MNPLLEAAVAAREVGLVVPECEDCEGARGFKSSCYHNNFRPCLRCHATGINPDPALLGWVAFAWLVDRGLLDSSRHMQTWSDWNGGPKLHEEHDRTPTGLAAALLRLVARVGGKQP